MDAKKRLLAKTPTGIEGLDEITHGGLPRGRATLVSGSAGAGKTVLAMEFLIHGILRYDEPGVFMSFEESATDLAENVSSFGYDLEELQKKGKLVIDHVQLDRGGNGETGGYDLEGLFIRLGSAVDEIGAKRVVLDTIEALFSVLKNESAIRGELLRLFRWIKGKGLTAIVTAERGKGTITRYGLEEYVADCVILLDHRLNEQVSTRRLRILKYRGSLHETDEHPFLMGEGGISVLPLSSAGLSHAVSNERVSSGVADLDKMLGGKGFFSGSSILVSGTPGTGKSSLAFSFLKAACARGETALYFGFEESSAQTIRNMRSIGMDLGGLVDKGLLHFSTLRPSSLGLEAHLAAIHHSIRRYQPKVVVLDPISVFMSIAEKDPVKSMLTRLVDFLKAEQITTLFTHLSSDSRGLEAMEQRVSSIMDTWLLLRDEEFNGRRRAMLYVLKSRGMAHSREVVEFVLTDKGIHLGSNAARKRANERA
jgi:circadian clock protein KaiC